VTSPLVEAVVGAEPAGGRVADAKREHAAQPLQRATRTRHQHQRACQPRVQVQRRHRQAPTILHVVGTTYVSQLNSITDVTCSAVKVKRLPKAPSIILLLVVVRGWASLYRYYTTEGNQSDPEPL
jgi:hypothetical protein